MGEWVTYRRGVLEGCVGVAAAARRIGVSDTYVRDLIEAGELDGTLIDRDAKRKQWAVTDDSIERYVARRAAAGRAPVVDGTLTSALDVSKSAFARAESLEVELETTRRELHAALRARDEQTTLAMALADQLDDARAELEVVLQTQMQLLAARQSALRRRAGSTSGG
jgi:hypothetical protein